VYLLHKLWQGLSQWPLLSQWLFLLLLEQELPQQQDLVSTQALE
jgi:hypothetical protein